MDIQKKFIFSGLMDTSYSQMYIVSGDYAAGLMSYDAFTGQSNGLCGGVVRGGLYLRLGVHTGKLHMTVEVHNTAPAVDSSWEEIVEASCYFTPPPISLQGWGGDSYIELPLSEGDYRARLCAKGYGHSEEQDKFGDPSIESYCLVLWPEPPHPDEVIKQTSTIAIFRNQMFRAKS
jgi:hypothetical protein